jgi:hypothetical protein
MPLAVRSMRAQNALRYPGVPLFKLVIIVCALLATSYAQTPQYTQGLPTGGWPSLSTLHQH